MEDLVAVHALVRVPPVSQELTGSWVGRLAQAYGLPVQDLLRGAFSGPRPVKVTGAFQTAPEVFLNEPARAALGRLTRTPPARLHERLPSFAPTHERLTDGIGPQAGWFSPRRAWVTACLPCTRRSWSPRQPVLVYPGAAGHVCHRHRRWLLADARISVSAPLQALPEVLAAHRHHTSLLRARPQAAEVMALASAVVWSWQVQGWHGDPIWQRRAVALASFTGCSAASAAAHALVPYPETIAVARVLGNRHWHQRLRTAAAGQDFRAAHGLLLEEFGRRTGRPWLSDWMIARTRRGSAAERDPVLWWLERLLASGDAPEEEGLWRMPASLARPHQFGDRVPLSGGSPVRPVIDDARAAFLTGGWEPTIVTGPGEAASCR
ncbi:MULTISPECIES: TniQ family protein [Streptomyces]|uniref:TniQ family protein n=1 Tax=Streptomyces TaxID=1883 RepID=UPI000A865D87|nr:TniQ family protein [Streptomyces sp. CB00271]